MLMGFLVLNYNPGVKSIIGAAVAIVAMVAYTKVNMDEVEERRRVEQARQRDKVCSDMHSELSATAINLSDGRHAESVGAVVIDQSVTSPVPVSKV